MQTVLSGRGAIEPGDAYWARDAETLLTLLNSGESGLADREALRRLRFTSPTRWLGRARGSALRLFFHQFKNPLVLILVFATGMSMLVADWVEAGVVLSIVVASTTLAFTQEFSANRTFERLAARVRVLAVVVRNGQEKRIPAEQVVPGDVLLLTPGCLIPADCVILSAEKLYVNQATLTGESFPAHKQPGRVAPQTALANRVNCVYLGSSVDSGQARALAVRTAQNTVFGQIAEQLASSVGPTEFERGVRRFGQLLMRTMLVVVLWVLMINLFRGKPAIDTLMFSLALAVGLTPELLPAIVSVMLAHGARHLAHRGVIVRKLNAIESLGGMTVLCTDKTGTLTTGAATLHAALDINGTPSNRVLRLAVINATTQLALDNPIDQAIRDAGKRAGIDTSETRKWDEIPLDYDRKCVSVIVAGDAQSRLLIAKGAFDQILSRCTSMGDPARPLGAEDHSRMMQMQETWAAQGFRILGVAVRTMDPSHHPAQPDDERNLCFMGFLRFVDEPKSDTREMIQQLRARGVDLKMITGDDDHVARTVAEAVGLPCARIITGTMITQLSDQALMHVAAETHVFAEVDPSQKERVVRALQRMGAVVGFLGDGVNDALALHTADIGISVSNAVDVAREASDFVLLRKELRLICDGIDEGRRTFANTMKYVLSTTSANFGNMISMGVISAFLPFIPLLPSQVLLNNFLSDIPAAALSGDRVDRQWVARPHRFDTTFIRNYMILFGLISVCFDVLLFAILLWGISLNTDQFRTAWFIESLLTELAVLLVIRSVLPFHQSRPSAMLLWLTVAIAGLALLLPYMAIGQVFSLVPLPGWLIAGIIAITVIYALTVEVVKRRMFRYAHYVVR